MAAVLSQRANRIATLVLTAALVAGLAVGGVALGVAGSGDQAESSSGDDSADDTAQVRIVHAVPDAPTVDVAIDGETVLTNVSYGDVTEYVSVSQGMHTVTVTTSNESDEVLFEGNVSVDASGNYTYVASAGTDEPIILSDDAPELSEDEAAVRLVHLVSDAGPVDVTVESTGEVLFDNVSFTNATEYQTVPAGDYTLEVREATEDNDGEVLATVNVSLEGGEAYSVFAMGTLEDEVQFVVASDPVPDATETETETETETATEAEETAMTETAVETETVMETETATETETETEADGCPATETETETATETETGTATETATGTTTETETESTMCG